MSGAKIQVSKARDVIKKSQIPQEDKGTVLDAISFCYDQGILKKHHENDFL